MTVKHCTITMWRLIYYNPIMTNISNCQNVIVTGCFKKKSLSILTSHHIIGKMPLYHTNQTRDSAIEGRGLDWHHIGTWYPIPKTSGHSYTDTDTRGDVIKRTAHSEKLPHKTSMWCHHPTWMKWRSNYKNLSTVPAAVGGGLLRPRIQAGTFGMFAI